ncbi:YqhG family protein [Sulfoacidibacillus thermotolerans]|uniref:Uncharacterized protein n=1 Tax=Sulfoacidibacillus thermotolerans TaxID=1765684 RepID=A0A2U3DBZ5_SULT2|nr:YqhG family protein [Sulfoacidibacillus thermotolerans]PWI58803.1 hypothetical protein BM613_01550 [Sulfoacidibacillus thermotolerans]
MPFQSDLYMYCKRYFETVGATFLPAQEGALCVEIPRDVDKELTDRPFYWMWVEAMNENPPCTILYLTFSPELEPIDAPERAKPELITPGCYRMMRIYASAKTRGTFASTYESEGKLSPYAIFIVKISLISDRRQDFLESYAIDLTNLQVYGNVMEHLTKRKLQDERPLHAQIFPVPIDMDQIFTLLLQCVRLDVEERDHTWAKDAKKRLENELSKLDHYYLSILSSKEKVHAQQSPKELDRPFEKTLIENAQTNFESTTNSWSIEAERELRKAELIWRMEPKIEVRPQQIALAYLASAPV